MSKEHVNEVESEKKIIQMLWITASECNQRQIERKICGNCHTHNQYKCIQVKLKSIQIYSVNLPDAV